LGFAVCAALLGCALVSSSAATGASLPGIQRISDERNVTFWANAARTAPIYAAPFTSSRKVARLRFATEDGFPEVYLLLREWRDPMGQTWFRVRIPKRPNGQQGWVKAQALDPPQVVRTLLVIDRRRLRATLFKKRRRTWSSPVGVGKPGTPTPRGRFWIRERMSTGDPGGLYGPVAFGTSAYSSLSDWPGGGVVGIHGTNAPELIPGRPSHGCVRVPNRAIKRLAKLMPIGTPVRIV
jgi:hypothetical protein